MVLHPVSGRSRPRFTLLGIGAAASPRFPPAGLLVEHRRRRVMLDGGPGAEAEGRLHAWLVTDERAELMPAIRRAARARGLEPAAGTFEAEDLLIELRPVVHTTHPAFGYLIEAAQSRVVWAPEFLQFPAWAAGADLMFAEAAGWTRPIRFRGGTGGHAAALDVAKEAEAQGVRRLVLAHIGRPALRALDEGHRPPFGEIGQVGRTYRP
jgi:hypothetical protein